MGTYTHKVIFVTGAGVGIGLALCKAFALAGAAVVLNDLDTALSANSAQAINDAVGMQRVEPVAFDVADVVARHGRVDVFVANAGLTNYGSFMDYTPEAFDRLLAVNLRGSYFTAQAAAHAMIERNIAGRILLMSSVTGTRAFLNLSAYGRATPHSWEKSEISDGHLPRRCNYG